MNENKFIPALDVLQGPWKSSPHMLVLCDTALLSLKTHVHKQGDAGVYVRNKQCAL